MSKSIKGTVTERNLLQAFAGECQAKNRYEMFADQAKAEGYEQIASIFAKTAQQEQSHAKQFIKFMEGGTVEINSTFVTGLSARTIDNLRSAVEEECRESSELYLQFSETAKAEGFPAIAAIFYLIAKVEGEHAKRFKKLLKRVEEGTVFKRDKPIRWECLKCGHVHEGENPPKICPACNHPTGYFEEIAENY